MHFRAGRPRAQQAPAQTPPAAPAQAPAQTPTNQQPAVTFRAETNFVEVHAIVTDQKGAFVKDLEQGDFEIYEDGRLQAPTVFSMVDLGIERPFTPVNAAGPIEPDVRATTRTFDGRIYIFLLDDLHTYVTRTNNVRELVKRFIDQYLGTDDLAAVVFTSGRQESGQELTEQSAAAQGRSRSVSGSEASVGRGREAGDSSARIGQRNRSRYRQHAGGPHGGRASACAVGS